MECNSLALAQYAPRDDPGVGVNESTGEVFFKPIPNDGSTNAPRRWRLAFPFEVHVRYSSTYTLTLGGFKKGASKLLEYPDWDCRSSLMAEGNTDSFFVCTTDPRSQTPAQPIDTCSIFTGLALPISLSAGANTLWLAASCVRIVRIGE